MEQGSTSDQKRGHDAWKEEVGTGRREEAEEQGGAGGGGQEPGGVSEKDGTGPAAESWQEAAEYRVASGKSWLGRGGCFRKGCSQKVKRTSVSGFANSSAQQTTLPTGHKNMREDLRCSSGLWGAHPASNSKETDVQSSRKNPCRTQKREQTCTEPQKRERNRVRTKRSGKRQRWTRAGQRDRRPKRETGPMMKQKKRGRGHRDNRAVVQKGSQPRDLNRTNRSSQTYSWT